jgi:hypothetical protein
MYIAWDCIIQIVYYFFHVFCVYSVLLSNDFMYSHRSGDQGGPIFFRQDFFLAVVLCTNWCNTNCIISISHKTNTNLLHTNSFHSISHKIGHRIQIGVHQFVHKTTAKKFLESEINWSPLIPKYTGIRKISTKDYRVHTKHIKKRVD